jgi:hypothetical protein
MSEPVLAQQERECEFETERGQARTSSSMISTARRPSLIGVSVSKHITAALILVSCLCAVVSAEPTYFVFSGVCDDQALIAEAAQFTNLCLTGKPAEMSVWRVGAPDPITRFAGGPRRSPIDIPASGRATEVVADFPGADVDMSSGGSWSPERHSERLEDRAFLITGGYPVQSSRQEIPVLQSRAPQGVA